jgi:hypothetical protein
MFYDQGEIVHSSRIISNFPLMAIELKNRELQEYCSDFSSLKEQAEKLSADLTGDQFTWKPAENKWSVAECLDHLNVGGGMVLSALQKAIDRGHRKGIVAEPPFTYGFFSRMFPKIMEPSSRLKMKSVRLYLPAPAADLDKESVVTTFLQLQDDYIEQIQRSDGLDLRRIRVSSPAIRLLRLILGAWFAVTLAHEKRHMEQAHRVKLDPGFPK